MSPNLDYQLMPVARRSGQDQPTLPGLTVVSAPRRSSRPRGQDQLILYLELTGNHPDLQSQVPAILQSLVRVYYDTPGSTTSALRTSAEELNRQLLNRNIQDKGKGFQSLGYLTQVVLKQNNYYLAQSGPVHAFVINSAGVQQFHDPALSGRALGLSQAIQIRYLQGEVKAGDRLLLSARPSTSWTPEALKPVQGLGLEAARKWLLSCAAVELSAVLLEAQPGQGRSQIVPLATSSLTPAVKEAAPPVSGPATEKTTAEPATGQAKEPSPGKVVAVSGAAAITAGAVGTAAKPASSQQPTPPPATPSQTVPKTGQEGPPVQAVASVPVQKPTEAPVQQGNLTPEQASPPVKATPILSTAKTGSEAAKAPNPFLVMIVTVGEAFRHAFTAFGRSAGRFLAKLFPDELFDLSNKVMAVLAIAIPVVVVSAASMAYLQLGRADQGRQFFLQAGEQAALALGQQEPLSRRSGLMTASDTLTQAETYGGVPQTQIEELRSRIYLELDQLDQIYRVQYQPALVDALDETAQISRLLVVYDNLYMLDDSTGSVLRALETPQGYQLDPDFQCGPAYVIGAIGPLVDIVLWPDSYLPDASVMGIDASGLALFCQPGQSPEVKKLAPPVTGNFKPLTGLSIDRGSLYVLDPGNNAVWIYPAGKIEEEPYLYFDEQIPPLQDVIDMAANLGELYMLHTDGRITFCFADVQGISPTKCIDPVPYMDFRTGRENTNFTPESPFIQLYANPSPDPSLYLLQQEDASVTHFSFRELGFQEEYSPYKPLGGAATAFTLRSLDRVLYLAVGSQVYYGIMP